MCCKGNEQLDEKGGGAEAQTGEARETASDSRPMTKAESEKIGKGGNRERSSFQKCHEHAFISDRCNKRSMQQTKHANEARSVQLKGRRCELCNLKDCAT
eukprot:5371310-Pleurochrysis_carterae.AAC.1